MLCPNCKKEIGDAVQCPFCSARVIEEIETQPETGASETALTEETGTQPAEAAQSAPEAPAMPKKKVTFGKKQILAVIVVAAVFLAGVLSAVLFQNPSKKFTALVEKGKTQNAIELYNKKIAKDPEKSSEVQARLTENLEKIYQQYFDEKCSYEDAIEKLAHYKGYPIIAEKQLETEKKLQALNASRIAFRAGKEAEATDTEKAIRQYKAVIEEDPNYAAAMQAVDRLKAQLKSDMLAEADVYAKNGEFEKAIITLSSIESVIGTDEDVQKRTEEYLEMKNEAYVSVRLKGKGQLPRDTSARRYSPSVTFVFEITNKTDKDIKGIEGTTVFKDMFGKQILSADCDFTGILILAGETVIVNDIYYEVNQFMDHDIKLYNTAYGDLQFEYQVKSIVFTDGTKVEL